MILTHLDLVALAESGVIENYDPANINGASIDLRLGDELLLESRHNAGTVDLATKGSPPFSPLEPESGEWILEPGEFALGSTMERFNLPDDICFEFKLRSSIARAGLNHSLAGFADPGWTNATLTLELKNILQYSKLALRSGLRIGQAVFYRGRPVPNEKSYSVRGRYNGQSSPTISLGA